MYIELYVLKEECIFNSVSGLYIRKTMKRRVERVLALILSLVMIALPVFGTQVVSWAEEGYDENFTDYYDGEYYYDDPSYYESAPTVMQTDDGGESGDPSWHDDDYTIVADTYNVSFGRVPMSGYALEYIPITITNMSSNPINLAWYKSDAEKVFLVDAPDSLYLGAGENLKFYVSMDTDYYAGSYSATLLIGSDEDPDFSQGVTISLSGTLTEPDPIVYSVEVYPSQITMARGALENFWADVEGDFLPDYTVEWSILGNTDVSTTIDKNGYLSIGDNENADMISVYACSIYDRSVTDYANVYIESENYTVTTCSNPGNGGTTVGGGAVKRGGSLTVNAAPNNGYEFVNWTMDGKEVSTSPQYTVSGIRKNISLVANFRSTACYVKVTKNNDKAGKVTDSRSVKYGDNMTLDATANSGYTFEGWYENDKFISSSKTINITNITSNREFVAKFSQNVFNVQVQANPSNVGMVSGSGNYSKGSNVAISAKPVEGYRFVSWMVNNEVISTDANCTIKNVDRDFVLVAIFEPKQVKTYEIAATVATGSGQISPSGLTKVAEGSSMVYTFAPANGYIISAVAVDGKQLGAISSYSFTNIGSNHSIAVAFSPKPTDTGKINKNTQTDNPGKSAKPTPLPVVKNDEDGKMTNEPVEYDNRQEEADIINEETNVVPEMTGNDEYVNLDELTGVLQIANITEEQAGKFIDDDKDLCLLELAARNQYLKVTVHNEYAQTPTETENSSFMNLVSMPNLQEVVDRMFTKEEKLTILRGNDAAVNVNIFDNTDLQTRDDKEIARIAQKDNVNIGKYFEIVMMKTYQGASSIVTETQVPMRIVMKVPEELKASGRTFCVIRAHQGQDGNLTVSFLQDLDDDPTTITIETNQFSSYAIGYIGGDEGTFTKKNVVISLMIMVVIAIIATVVCGIVISVKHRRRRKR